MPDAFEFMIKIKDGASAAIKKISNTFKALGSQVKKAALSLKNSMTSMFSGVANIIEKAVSAQSDLIDIYLGLGMNVRKGSKEMINAYKVMSKLEFGLGLSTEEAKALVNAGHGLQLFGKDLEKWAVSSAEYAKATGQSAESVGDLFFQMKRVHGLGTEQLRGMGAAMKFIGDKSAISHSELASFMKSLDQYFVNLPGQGKEAAAKMSIQVGAIAGLMADHLGDPANLSSALAKMADPTSPEGAQISGIMGKIAGMSGNAFQKAMKTAPGPALAAFAEGMGKMDERTFQMQKNALSDITGFSTKDLRSFQKMGGNIEDVTKFLADAQKNYDKETRAKEKAAQMTNWYAKQQEQLRRVFLKLMATIGRPFMKIIMDNKKSIIDFVNKITPMVNEFVKGFEQKIIDFGTSFSEWMGPVQGFFSKIPWKTIGDNIHWIAAGFGAIKLAGLLGGLKGALALISGPVGLVAGALAFGAIIGKWAGQLEIAGAKLHELAHPLTERQRTKQMADTINEFSKQQKLGLKKGVGVLFSGNVAKTSNSQVKMLGQWASAMEHGFAAQGKERERYFTTASNMRDKFSSMAIGSEKQMGLAFMDGYASQLKQKSVIGSGTPLMGKDVEWNNRGNFIQGTSGSVGVSKITGADLATLVSQMDTRQAETNKLLAEQNALTKAQTGELKGGKAPAGGMGRAMAGAGG